MHTIKDCTPDEVLMIVKKLQTLTLYHHIEWRKIYADHWRAHREYPAGGEITTTVRYDRLSDARELLVRYISGDSGGYNPRWRRWYNRSAPAIPASPTHERDSIRALVDEIRRKEADLERPVDLDDYPVY
jgi:hypothetical protein